MKNRLVWFGLAALAGVLFWRWRSRVPRDYVSIGWGAPAGVPTLAPMSRDQRLGNFDPLVPPPPGANWSGDTLGAQDGSRGNLGSGGW